jgi:hypothetical protein
MTNKPEAPEILISTYGKDAPDAAKFDVGAQTRQQVEQAADARRAMSDASKPRKYSTR